MESYPIGLTKLDNGHWQVDIPSLGLCAITLRAASFDDASVVAGLMIASHEAHDSTPRTKAPRSRVKSAA